MQYRFARLRGSKREAVSISGRYGQEACASFPCSIAKHCKSRPPSDIRRIPSYGKQRSIETDRAEPRVESQGIPRVFCCFSCTILGFKSYAQRQKTSQAPRGISSGPTKGARATSQCVTRTMTTKGLCVSRILRCGDLRMRCWTACQRGDCTDGWIVRRR
jgi:hypothetical protein